MSGPQSLTIDSTWLHVEDGSLSQPDSALVYTVTALPQYGTLTVDGTTVAVNGQFTQQQVDDGLVVYTENGPTAVADSFGFAISDASSGSLATGTFNVGQAGGAISAVFSGRTISVGTTPVIIFSGPGHNSFNGGTDTTVSYALAPNPTTIILSGLSPNGFGGTDTLVDIHNVIGTSHDDVIFSGPGDNLIFGGGGDDRINGAGGNDTAGYSGARSDYLVIGGSAYVQIIDMRPGSPDGADTLTSIQSFKFSDGTYSFAQLGAIDETDQSGATALAAIGNHYFLYGVKTTIGPELTYDGTPWTDGQWGHYEPLAAEATAIGYEVAFKIVGTDLYTVWNTDWNGNITTDTVGTVTGSSLTLEALEASFHQDLNGDSVIGLPPGDTLIESFGSTSLIQTGSNYVFDKAGSDTELHYDGAAFVVGQFGGWTPVGVEATANGYEVAFHLAGTDQYTVWDTDANGNITIDPVGSVAGDSAALAAIERSFHQDLNGDALIGNPAIAITVESSGATSLVLTNRQYFLDPNGTSSGPMLKYDGLEWRDGEWGGWTPVGAEVTANGHEVAFNLEGTNQYTVWNTDASGNLTTDTIGNFTSGSATLQAVETGFHQDLDGDGIIGDPSIPVVIESSGLTSLTEINNHFFLYDKGTSNGPELSYDGAPWSSGEWGGWTPIAAETTGAAYDVAFRLAGSDLYTFWYTDANGNMIGDSIGSVSGSDPYLQSMETVFHQDLNGDNVIGIAAPITAPASGNATLTGTAATDGFVFHAQFGNDTVKNFQPAQDEVFIDHTVFASIADVVGHTADNAGGSAVVTISPSQSITFEGVSTAVLQQHAFNFDFHIV